MRTVKTERGHIRVRTAGVGERRVVFACDPPNGLEVYGPLFARLKPHARVMAFEPPGFGRSTASRQHRHTLDDSVESIIALLDAEGGAPSVLAFPCVAAYAALIVAARRPDLVKGLVLIQAPSWTQQRAWADRVDRGGVLRAPVIGPLVNAASNQSIAGKWYATVVPDPEASRRFAMFAIEAMEHGARFPLASAFRGLFVRSPEPTFAPVDCPVLGVWGDKDRSHARSNFESLLEHAPHAELHTMSGVGHFPELEASDAFARRLIEWMDKHQL